MESKQDLKTFKKKYEEIAKKYSLPDFKSMNEKFEIERIYEKETELFLKDIRRVVIEKVSNHLRFTEMFFNPGNAPIFFMKMLKNLKPTDKKKIEEIYQTLSYLEIDGFCLDVTLPYDEKKEAEFIKKCDAEFDQILSILREIMSGIKECFEDKCENKNKSYFG